MITILWLLLNVIETMFLKVFALVEGRLWIILVALDLGVETEHVFKVLFPLLLCQLLKGHRAVADPHVLGIKVERLLVFKVEEVGVFFPSFSHLHSFSSSFSFFSFFSFFRLDAEELSDPVQVNVVPLVVQGIKRLLAKDVAARGGPLLPRDELAVVLAKASDLRLA